jgi:protein-disulfide isomerase
MRYLLLLVPAALLAAQTTSTAPRAAAKTAATHKTAASEAAPVTNFKESGSPTAPITVEVYTDYECPACRELYLNTLPPLNQDFVATGKVRLLHRDFPLQMHRFSRVATRYANAAGAIGKYDVVAQQIFATQPDWAQNGNVDGDIAKVVPAADMDKIRNMVKNDTHLDDTVTKDMAMGNNVDHVNQTPTIVIVAKGKREVIGGGMPYAILKQYLNQKLAQ